MTPGCACGCIVFGLWVYVMGLFVLERAIMWPLGSLLQLGSWNNVPTLQFLYYTDYGYLEPAFFAVCVGLTVGFFLLVIYVSKTYGRVSPHYPDVPQPHLPSEVLARLQEKPPRLLIDHGSARERVTGRQFLALGPALVATVAGVNAANLVALYALPGLDGPQRWLLLAVCCLPAVFFSLRGMRGLVEGLRLDDRLLFDFVAREVLEVDLTGPVRRPARRRWSFGDVQKVQLVRVATPEGETRTLTVQLLAGEPVNVLNNNIRAEDEATAGVAELLAEALGVEWERVEEGA